MKQILIMTMLAAGMLLAGCSKDESENVEEPRKENVMEQTLTKEQIVGVWRSGDYWVSFSEDGYCGAYLSNKCVAEQNVDFESGTHPSHGDWLLWSQTQVPVPV